MGMVLMDTIPRSTLPFHQGVQNCDDVVRSLRATVVGHVEVSDYSHSAKKYIVSRSTYKAHLQDHQQ